MCNKNETKHETFERYPGVTTNIDATGLRCPMPLLKAKQGLNLCKEYELIEVITTDPQSVRDFNAFVDLTRHELVHYQCIKSEVSVVDKLKRESTSPDKHCFVIRKV